MVWTIDMENKLREMWPDKAVTTSKISEVIGGGLSRSAIIGKANRMGLGVKPGYEGTTRAGRILAKAKPRPKRVRQTAVRFLSNHPDKKREPFKARTVALPPLNLSIIEVSDGQCKYIAGDDHLCCGHPVKGGHSWCPSHCEIVYQASSERTPAQQAADAVLRRRTSRRATEATKWMAEEAA